MPSDTVVVVPTPEPQTKTRRPGKRSVNWKKDPEILARLQVVAELLIRGATGLEIAASTSQSLATAKRDIARVRELWTDDAKESVTGIKAKALATYEFVQKQSWSEAFKDKNANRKDKFMTIVLNAQARIDKISGLEIDRHEIGGPEGGPILVEDIEAIRKQRWDQITGNLQDVLTETSTTQVTPTQEDTGE